MDTTENEKDLLLNQAELSKSNFMKETSPLKQEKSIQMGSPAKWLKCRYNSMLGIPLP